MVEQSAREAGAVDVACDGLGGEGVQLPLAAPPTALGLQRRRVVRLPLTLALLALLRNMRKKKRKRTHGEESKREDYN